VSWGAKYNILLYVRKSPRYSNAQRPYFHCFLPFTGLPTTPFILLSSFAFLRSSETFYNWLVHSKVFGPIITQWAEHRALPSKRVKVVGLICTVSCFSASVIYFAAFSNYSWASLILGMLCVAVCIFLIRLPVVAMI